MLLNVSEYSTKTIYDQVYDQVLGKILSAELKPGEQLDSIGLVARVQRISKNTVRRVYDELAVTGVIEFKNEVGYHVSNLTDELKSKLKTELEQKEINIFNSETINQVYKEAVYKHKIEEELILARQIQAELLPSKSLVTEALTVYGYSRPSRVVCGDFYDYFRINTDKYGFVIADASGKGMPAAILISQIQAILKSELGNGTDIKHVMAKLNNHLIQNSSAGNFTTLLYGIYDSMKGTFEYANAGHNLPVVLKHDGSFELLKTTSPALGLVKNFNFETKMINLSADSTILFYTDGITETMNETGEQLGEGRLIELLLNDTTRCAELLISKVIKAVEVFESENYAKDDRTLMVLNIKSCEDENCNTYCNVRM